MASRSSMIPREWVYWQRPSRMALQAASLTHSGVSKSGSPICRCTMSRPCFSRAHARSSTSMTLKELSSSQHGLMRHSFMKIPLAGCDRGGLYPFAGKLKSSGGPNPDAAAGEGISLARTSPGSGWNDLKSEKFLAESTPKWIYIFPNTELSGKIYIQFQHNDQHTQRNNPGFSRD